MGGIAHVGTAITVTHGDSQYTQVAKLAPQGHGKLVAAIHFGRQRIYSARDRTRLKLTLRGKRLGFALQEIKDIIDMYESPRDTLPQLKKFLGKLAEHRNQLERQREDLEATLAELRVHEQECLRLLGKRKNAT